jgi:hypothetical protein
MTGTAGRTAKRQEFLADVITTAVEGGINYWSTVSGYKWFFPDLDGGSAEHEEGMANAYVTVHPEDEDVSFYIDTEKIEEAINRILDAGPVGPNKSGGLLTRYGWSQVCLASKESDAGEIDADIADCIVQVACFGELVYG